MPEHVLIVGPGRDFPERIRRASPGARTTVMCDVAYLDKVADPGANVRVIGIHSDAPTQEWIELASAVHQRDPFTRIGSFGDLNQHDYAAVAEALGLVAHSPRTVSLVHDKAAMRRQLGDAGVDTTAAARVADLEELRTFVERHGLPCMVKPISSSGSAGVTKVESETDLESAFERASGSYLGLHNSGVLVEEFLDGPQYSVEAFSERGKHEVVGITRKYSDPQSFVELGHVSPAPLSPIQGAAIRAYVGHILDALGVEAGTTHTEITLGSKGPRLIETHLRKGGDQISDLTRDATGVDIDDCSTRQVLGEDVLPGIHATLATASGVAASAIWFASVGTTGVFDAVSGTEAAEAMPGVTEVSVLAKPGDEVTALATSESRVASVRAVGATADEALGRARDAASGLEFSLRVRAAETKTI